MPSQYSRKHYNEPEEGLEELREKIIGLGEESFRKSYYPELQEKLADLEKYKALLDQSNDAIFLIELPSGKFLDMSESACKQLGYMAGKCYAMTLFDMVSGHTEDLERIFSGEKESLILEAMLRKGNGKLVPYEMNMRRVTFHNKDYLVVVARDITERKRAEEALRESEEKFRLLADFTYDWENWIGPTGDFLYVSPSCERVTGHKPDEFYRDPVLLLKLVHPDDRAAYKQHVEDHLIAGAGSSSIDFRIVTASDETRWVGHVCQPVYGNSGEWLGSRSSNRDITERKRAEEALRMSETRLAKAQEIAHLGSWDISLPSLAMVWSDELYRIFGVRPGEFKPSIDAVTDATYPDDRELFRTATRRMVSGLKPEVIENRIIRPDGTIRFVRAEGTIVYDKHGKPAHIFGTAQDITERKRDEEALKAAKMQAELYLDLMGHDIRNYNQIAIGFLELAMDILVRDPAEQELLSRPIDAINKSSRLIDNIMKIRRVTVGKALKNKLMDICDILDRIKTSYSNIPGRQVTINYHPIPECSIMANDLIYDIFTNLIDNSIKYTKPDKLLTIDIRVKKQIIEGKEYLKVSIEDNGPGIADEQKEKLFTLLEPGKTKATGRGLGLYLVRTLAENFGGGVWVEDRVTGDYHQGVRFIIVLPTET